MSALRALKIQEDPEAIFQEGWLLCDTGEHELGLDLSAAGRRKGILRHGDSAAAAGSSIRCAVRRNSRRFSPTLKRAGSGH